MSKTFEEGRDEVSKLCRYFTTNRQQFSAPGVKEAHIRQSLIDPMFEALGWDVSNRQQIAPQYRDVVPEDSVDVEGQLKAPDYTFRVGTLPKFFAEAKKCGVNIHSDPAPAYQLRRYGWSAKVPLSVLTDFEEFAVYDCSVRPRETDKASRSRILYLGFEEYPDRWRELWDIFSREAVWSGAFDQYAASKRKRGTSEVDDEFLKEIEGWRTELARNIALRNKEIESDELNAAVQLTIDRIVFLRMAEDRGLEPYEQLLKLCERPGIYERFMRELCRKADEKYNSGLFHFNKEVGVSESPDRITPKLKVDDKILKPIIEGLYFEHGSPYDFRVLPVEILGTVYERFLGKVIRLTPGHQAKIEEKPEVRKAGGVYYTPAYIVNFIVRQTVAKQVDSKSPTQLAGGKSKPTFRVLDMACGSGSFLLGAYQYLLDYCLKWYTDHNPETQTRAVYKDPRDDQWRLTIEEKKRILTTHIFGVDIDPQAVEVTKLSLLLKALEGESDATLSLQMKLFEKHRALPNLADNIKCGNSLIASDYFAERLTIDPDEIARINAFDWNVHLSEAMRAGGFDCIIGNPPWGGDIDRDLDYFHKKFRATTQEHTDSFKLFIEQGVRLARVDGFTAMIVPSTILRQRRLKDVRTLLMRSTICSLVDLGENVFKGVVAPSCIFVVQRAAPSMAHRVEVASVSSLSVPKKVEALVQCKISRAVRQADFHDNPDLEFIQGALKLRVPVVALGQLDVLQLKDAGINYQRVGTGMQDKGKSDLADRLLYQGKQERASDRMYWKGTDIDRYWIEESTDRFCRPSVKKSLRANEVVSLNEEVFSTVPKILFRQTADHLIATIDGRGVWFGRSIIALVVDRRSEYKPQYFLAILNSRLFKAVYDNVAQEAGRVFAQVKLSKVKQLPIRVISFSNTHESAIHDRIVELVDSMLALRKRLAMTTDARRGAVERLVDATEREIDRLVYELYGLSDEEIALVEATNGTNTDQE